MNNAEQEKRLPVFLGLLKDHLVYVLALPAILTVVYSLYVFFPFGTYDDYARAWEFITSPSTFGLSQLKTNFLDGRLFNGMFLWLFFKPNSISYLGIYRLYNLFLLFAFALFLYSFLQRKVSRISAFALTVIICSLPSFSIMFYFTSLMGVIAGGIFAGLSVWLIDRYAKSHKPSKAEFLKIFLAVAALCISVQFYQPIAMFFWVFFAIQLAFDTESNIPLYIKKYAVHLIVFLLAMAFALFIIRLAPDITGLAYKSRTNLIRLDGVYDKVLWFFDVPLRQSLNFFLQLSIPRPVVLLTLLYIFIGFFFWFPGPVGRRILKTLGILMTLPAAYLPNLVVAENWASFRSMIAISAVWVVLISFSSKSYVDLIQSQAKRLSNIGRFAMMGWAFLAILFSMYHSVAYLLLPSFLEHRFIHYQIGEMGLESGDTVYVVLSRYYDSTSPFVYGDEFGIPTTMYFWGAQSLTKLVTLEYGFLPGQIEVVTIDDIQAVPKNVPDIHLLDMRNLTKQRLTGTMYPIDRGKGILDSILSEK